MEPSTKKLCPSCALRDLPLLLLISVFMGACTGAIGSLFSRATLWASTFHITQPKILFLLPFGGIAVTLLYKAAGYSNDGGANLIVKALNSGERVPRRMFFLAFASAVFSHLCGASVGRAGSTLQIGGSLGNFLADSLRLDRHKQTFIICGVAGVFTGLFGTPLACGIFAVEVATVGLIRLSALAPSLLCACVSSGTASLLGTNHTAFAVSYFPRLTPKSVLAVLALSCLAGLLSLLYCFLLQDGKRKAASVLKNPYLRGFALGSLLLLLTLSLRGVDYNGLGLAAIASAFSGEAEHNAFWLKMLFTFLSLAAGYKGGEIFPVFFIGSTLGATFGLAFNFAPSFMASVGVGAMFCGITNCPLAAFFLCLELFGAQGAVLYLVACLSSFAVSGKRSLYPSQQFRLKKPY